MSGRAEALVGGGTRRGVSTLLSLVTAIALLTVVTGGTLIVVEDAFRETARGDAERAVAVQASERLVAPSGPLAVRANVLPAEGADDLAASDLRRLGASERFAMAVRLDGERLASVGDPGSGSVIRRVVLLEGSERVTRTPEIANRSGSEVTVPVRTGSVELTLDPPSGTTVTTVRSDGRVVLHNESGLEGTHSVETAPYETLRFSFAADGELSTGDVRVAYDSTSRRKAVLAVTVDDVTGVSRGGETA